MLVNKPDRKSINDLAAYDRRKRYDDKFLKFTVRLDPYLEPQVRQLVGQFGDINSAIEHCILRFDLSNRVHRRDIKELEKEQSELEDENEKLREIINNLEQESDKIDDEILFDD